MERLTKRLPSGVADYNYPTSCYFDDNSGTDRIAQSAFRQRCVERLADYEETGLEPEEVISMQGEWCAMMSVFTSIGSYDRLRELAKADREGRCVVLPVKLHDKLYYVDKEQVRETEVESIHNWTSGRWKLSTHTDRQSTHWIGYEVDFDGIGKTVFLTREEAEAVLEAMKDG